MKIGLFIMIATLLLLSKTLISIWVYKDAKEKGINPIMWITLIWFFSGPLVFLIYFLVIRKEKNVKCEKCSFIQSEKLLYCGRCGSEIKIDQYAKDSTKDSNGKLLIISIVLLIIAMISGAVLIIGIIWTDGNNIPISIMSVSSKYGDKWNDTFKYKNGEWSHSFNLKDETDLNASWDVENGSIEAKLYIDNKLIKEVNSIDNKNYEELIDLSKYKDSKVVLQLKFIKTYGKIRFFLE